MMGITKSNQKTAKKEYRWLDRLLNSSFLFLSPYALLFGLLILLPVIVAFLLSFTYFNTVQFPEFIGFQNYIDLIMGDTIFLQNALMNTILYGVIVGPVGYMLAFFSPGIFRKLPIECGPFIQ